MFDAGHRLRVAVMGADADNTEPGPLAEPPTVRVHRGQPGRASSILLSVEDAASD